MSQGENPAQNHRMQSQRSSGVLALEQGSLSGRERWDKACHLATRWSLGCLLWRGREGGLLGEFQGLHEGKFVKGLCILPSIKRKKFVY